MRAPRSEPATATAATSTRISGAASEVTPTSLGIDGDPIGQLLGRSRAALLAHLDLPLSTTQLAAVPSG